MYLCVQQQVRDVYKDTSKVCNDPLVVWLVSLSFSLSPHLNKNH